MMALKGFEKHIADLPTTPIFPALFVGHGSPMNAITDTPYARGWKMLGQKLPKPSAILAISAHWLTKGTFVHVAERPRTIHDFGGFPKTLYDMTYPCPGSPTFARETRSTVKDIPIAEDHDWGIDHGTWVVLHHIYPAADVPVFQMSIDMSQPAAFHYALGRALAPLRERGVLILGSGNIVHNLGKISWDERAMPFDWALEFDETTRSFLQNGDHRALMEYEQIDTAALAIPTPDHYWPLLYLLGVQKKDEEITFPVEGIAHGSISMRAVLIGTP